MRKRRLDDGKRRAAHAAARDLLSNRPDIKSHNNQWRLDRARWQYQYGYPDQALAELKDMNALHRHYSWEGKPDYPEIPLSALQDPIGDRSLLGTRP